MATGTVKWFNASKGFGFITNDDDGKDIFLHFSELNCEGYKTVNDGAKVSFEVEQGDKGMKATKVNLL